MIRRFHIVAIPIRIVFNRFGDHNPNGMMFVLKENERKVKRRVAKRPFSPVELVQPLVIRANVGDEVEVRFENQLPFRASIHIQRAEYDVQQSDGSFVGFNEDSTAPPLAPGETVLYRWKVVHEGVHLFTDLGNPLSGEVGSNLNGLFGALIAEPKGSRWTDPVTGRGLESGAFADIHHPLLPSYREFVWFFHDEMETKNLIGETPLDPVTLQPSMTPQVNYRSEPMRNRMQLVMEGVVAPGAEGEEVHHDSWVFGDPATPVLRSYVGDPVKIRLIHAGVQETHVFHYHLHQWLFESEDQDSEIVDSQSISPQNFYTVTPQYGSGSLQEAFGDVIVHCHLYPHFMDGMWGMHRIFNTLQDGTQRYPNGVRIKRLLPLPDRPAPPKPTKEKPGFPNFIPGVFGKKAPRPPLGIVGGRTGTRLERNQFAPNARPGAVFVNPCAVGVTPTRKFHVVAIQIPICYNDHGWHDPEARIFVLAEDEEAIRSGRKKPEPLVLRANAGDCVELTFTNKLPQAIGGNAFQLAIRTYEASMHVHFVKFDPLVSDGANVGWNYDSSVLPGQTIRYQWYADVELRGVFFHDHLFANNHQNHGLFGGINIEPRGSRHLHPRTGKRIRSGTKATISNPYVPDFREISLFIHDFAMLYDSKGQPLNPPPFPSSFEDPGVVGINFRNEPLQFRLRKKGHDPAYVFSSFVHGDPATPMLETYNDDPVRIRLFQGAHEESHAFNLHRQRWHFERRDLDSQIVQQQHIGISEHFTLELAIEGEGDFDMLYHFGNVEDIWLGNWGIIRSFRARVPQLMPLPDRDPPPPRKRKFPPELPGKRTERPPAADGPGFPCPPDAPVRRFEVVALQTRIVYNEFGDHDPFGIVFALAEEEQAIRRGELNPEPLVLRANVGDCVEITLHNLLTETPHDDPFHGYPEVPVERPYRPSLRISLHPQLLAYDVRGSDGATVGFNPDQTVGPGESITYRWFVDRDVGACNLWDMADIRHHRHHGAFGVLVTETKGSTYLHPTTRRPIRHGSQAIVSHPLMGEFREFVIAMHDGVRLVDRDGVLIVDPDPVFEGGGHGGADHMEAPDFEDQGSRGFNYRAERFLHRLLRVPDVSKVFSSRVHGDPATPLFLAHAGDRIIMRLVFPADRMRAHTFVVHGHKWHRSPQDENSTIVSAKGQITVGDHDNFHFTTGAGGSKEIPGDYLYRSGNIQWDVELGLWGILRVLPPGDPRIARLRSRGGEP